MDRFREWSTPFGDIQRAPNPCEPIDMTKGCVSQPTTGHSFFAFPPEVRNMIYRHLPKATFTGLDWGLNPCCAPSPPWQRISEKSQVRPESDRLGILRAARQLNYEAISFLYRHSTFRFQVQRLPDVPPKMLGPEALSMIQHVEITVDVTLFDFSSTESEEKAEYVGGLRGLYGSRTPRKTCHVTTDCGWSTNEPSTRSVVRGLKTLNNFELLTLDVRFSPGINYDGYALPACIYFGIYNHELEPELGPGKFDTRHGHCCLSFHPMRERFIDDSPL